MKRVITMSIVLSVLMVLTASIMAVSSSAGPVSASGAAAMPSPTPKKVKKPGNVNANLSGGDDPQEVSGATRNQNTSGSTNRTAAPSTKPAKAGKTPKAASKPASNDYTYGTLPVATSGSTNRSTKNPSGPTGTTTAPPKKNNKKTAPPAAANGSSSAGTATGQTAPNQSQGSSGSSASSQNYTQAFDSEISVDNRMVAPVNRHIVMNGVNVKNTGPTAWGVNVVWVRAKIISGPEGLTEAQKETFSTETAVNHGAASGETKSVNLLSNGLPSGNYTIEFSTYYKNNNNQKVTFGKRATMLLFVQNQ